MRWAVFIGGWLAGASALATAGPSVVTEALGPNGILSAANMTEDVPLVPADIRDEVSFDYAAVQNRRARRPFESDHEFDGFVQPFSNPIQFKDPRAMTEARGLFIAAWSDPNMPLGDTSAQIYALQLRAALTERLEVFAAKDGIVRLSPASGRARPVWQTLRLAESMCFIGIPKLRPSRRPWSRSRPQPVMPTSSRIREAVCSPATLSWGTADHAVQQLCDVPIRASILKNGRAGHPAPSRSCNAAVES